MAALHDEFECLVRNGTLEAPLQTFLEGYPKILQKTFDDGSYYPTVFPKFRLADEFVPDFVIVGHRSSWLWTVNLIEIEPSLLSEPLFNKKRQPAGRLRDAVGQIDDWRAWMNRNRDTTFVRKALGMLKERRAWDGEPRFYHLSEGTHQSMYVRYRIVIGRREDFCGWGSEYQNLKWEEGIEIVPWDRLVEKTLDASFALPI